MDSIKDRSRSPYEPPALRDLGDVLEVTHSAHPWLVHTGDDLSFSSPALPTGVHPGTAQPGTTTTGPGPGLAGVSATRLPGGSGGGSDPDLGGGSGHGPQVELPFTGYPAAAVAGIGAALAASGKLVRRLVGRAP